MILPSVHNIHQYSPQSAAESQCSKKRVTHLPNHLFIRVFPQLNDLLFSVAATSIAIAARTAFRRYSMDWCRSRSEDVLELEAELRCIALGKLRVAFRTYCQPSVQTACGRHVQARRWDSRSRFSTLIALKVRYAMTVPPIVTAVPTMPKAIAI